MSIKRTNVTEADVERWIRQGRGQGEGVNYLQWVGVRDVPTRGRAYRPNGLITGRRHHLLSRIELGHFLKAESNPTVTDIREQFALLPLDLTKSIADELGIRHPRYPGTVTDCVMTSDLVVSRGGIRLLAMAIKPLAAFAQSEAKVHRVLEKLAIEQRYWEIQGHEWRLVTDAQVPATLRYNLIRFRPTRSEWLCPTTRQAAAHAAVQLKPLLCELPLRLALEAWATDFSEPLHRAQRLLGLAIWMRLLPIDLAKPINWNSFVLDQRHADQLAA